jgi:membrane protease YdiL (CAAX protease family)
MDTREKFLLPFRKFSTPKLILLTLIVRLIFSLVVSYFAELYDIRINTNALKFDSIKEELFFVVIAGPIVETFLCQYFLINLIISLTRFLFKKESISLAIFISALIFGLGHQYNYMYMALTFISGLLYGTFFVIIKYRKQDAFTCTTIVHALYNLFAFGMKHL